MLSLCVMIDAQVHEENIVATVFARIESTHQIAPLTGDRLNALCTLFLRRCLQRPDMVAHVFNCLHILWPTAHVTSMLDRQCLLHMLAWHVRSHCGAENRDAAELATYVVLGLRMFMFVFL
jgi:hypothetical protein